MKKTETPPTDDKKRLILRKDAIRALDNVDLPTAVGGYAPPDAGVPPKPPL